MGPLMLGLEAEKLTDGECRRLAAPEVGGVILFSRNYRNPDQLVELVRSIRAVRPDLLIAVDHEGGRVQRFREGFTHIPPMGAFGSLYDQDSAQAVHAVRECGWLLAAELRACDIDFSFAPVLDLDYGQSEVIGDRSFHRRPDIVATLASGLIAGMDEAGMGAVGKHFPGHGFVAADSHVAEPVDTRTLEEMHEDLAVFRDVIDVKLAGIMPAHVVYPAVDDQPAGFSRRWLDHYLRREFGFKGMIFSDDLNMAGAFGAGNMQQRATAAMAAGCDMVLVCNDGVGAGEVIEALHGIGPVEPARAAGMKGRRAPAPDLQALRQMPRWEEARALAAALAS